MPLWLKIGWTVWLAVWAPLYAIHYGAQNFLWFCDIGNFMIGAALWLESRFVFSWQATSLLLVQTVWVIDLLVASLSGWHPIGGTEYMFDAMIPIGIRLLSLFHLATPPILVWGLWRLGYDRRGWLAQCATAWVVLPVCWFFGPVRDINWVWGPFDKPQAVVAPWLYLAACMLAYPLLYLHTHLLLASVVKRRGASPPPAAGVPSVDGEGGARRSLPNDHGERGTAKAGD